MQEEKEKHKLKGYDSVYLHISAFFIELIYSKHHYQPPLTYINLSIKVVYYNKLNETTFNKST